MQDDCLAGSFVVIDAQFTPQNDANCVEKEQSRLLIRQNSPGPKKYRMNTTKF